MIKIGIIGSTGYAGGELARLLLQRDDVEIKWYGSKSYKFAAKTHMLACGMKAASLWIDNSIE